MEYIAEVWNQLLDFLRAQPPGPIYFFLFLSAFLESVFPPVPGDTMIVFGAYLAGIGILRVLPAYLVIWAGSVLGLMFVYTIAYVKGRDLLLSLESKWITESRMKKAESWFSRYGDRVVIFNRFLPSVRTFIGIVAGVARMHPLRMFAYVVLGTFLWNSLLVYFGLTVGENWRLVVDALQAYNWVVLGVMVVSGGIGYYWHRRRKARATGQPISDGGPTDRCA